LLKKYFGNYPVLTNNNISNKLLRHYCSKDTDEKEASWLTT